MPFLLPPPEFLPGELTKMGLTGTCEVQICRSAGPWSLGTPQKIEHSIQTAYLKGKGIPLHFNSSYNTTIQPFRCQITLFISRISSSFHRKAWSLIKVTASDRQCRTMVGDVKVENQIGDALVERAIRAHREKTPWRCCIMIPLLPGFTFPVDHSDASAVRPACYPRTCGC
jgi:phospholipase D1/2